MRSRLTGTIKIMYYEKDYCRHIMHGIFCKLCTDTSWRAAYSSGSACASSSSSGSISCEVKEIFNDDYMTDIVI
jgi:hypothetical protein